ncbi:MAG TPA: hypothetical protein VIJ47_13000, partial [Acidimicrobiales bacterium]
MRFSMRRCAALLMAALMACAIAPVVAAPAGADAIADKQAEAEHISARLTELDTQTEVLAEQFNQTRLQLDQVQVQIDGATTRVADAKAELAQRRSELADYAVLAYVKGGESDLPEILLKGSGPDVSRQIEYLQAASSSRRQLVDDVRQAQQKADGELTDLQAEHERARQLQADLDRRRAATKAATDEQSALLARVNGELGTLVAEAQARQAAAAEAEAKARLAAQAQTAPSTTQPPVAAPGPDGPIAPPTTPGPTTPGTTPPVTAPPVAPPDLTPVPWPVP